ncbi:hypothetical protein Prudu_013116 [Prunus dulcis]|uniref:Uncharacterized protein n=1 Tax=Prunus dulcis TaxID=3755 RepID=A0A4Y1RE67_PRUDU|nr:hypothetical protein Prudu_013116 [Prunus dulcis]
MNFKARKKEERVGRKGECENRSPCYFLDMKGDGGKDRANQAFHFLNIDGSLTLALYDDGSPKWITLML